MTSMDILFSGLRVLFPNLIKDNLTISTVLNTEETGDINMQKVKLMQN